MGQPERIVERKLVKPRLNVKYPQVEGLKNEFAQRKVNHSIMDAVYAIVKREFKERDIPMLKEFESIGEDQDFYLTDKSLGIYFQLYEYTPYVYGFPAFKIPYTELSDVIDEEGPVGRLTGQSTM